MNNKLSSFYEQRNQYFSNNFDNTGFVAERKSDDYNNYMTSKPTQEKIRLDIRNDYVFKAVYSVNQSKSKVALIALLNSIIDRKNDPIVDISYLNPISANEQINDKMIFLDIKVRTASGELINIEILTLSDKNYPDHSFPCSGEIIDECISEGEKYGKIQKLIVITIVYGKVFKENEDIHSIYRFLNANNHTELSDILEFHFIELDNLNLEHRKVSDLSDEERLAAYLKYSGDESKADFMLELLESEAPTGVIRMTESILDDLSKHAKTRELAEARSNFM